MLDERAEPVAPELRRHAFNNKTVEPARRSIAAVRLRTSFLLSLTLAEGLYHRRPRRSSVIGEITPNSIAAQAQIAHSTEQKPLMVSGNP